VNLLGPTNENSLILKALRHSTRGEGIRTILYVGSSRFSSVKDAVPQNGHSDRGRTSLHR